MFFSEGTDEKTLTPTYRLQENGKHQEMVKAHYVVCCNASSR